MATIVGGRVKYERMRELQRENDFLSHRLEVTRKMCHDLEYKIQRLEFRERWAMTAVGTLRRRIVYVLDSLMAQHLAKANGNKPPEFGFNILSAQCGACRGTGGAEISEDECSELGLLYHESVPRFHDPNGGYEYWCDKCIGAGNTLSTNEYVGV